MFGEKRENQHYHPLSGSLPSFRSGEPFLRLSKQPEDKIFALNARFKAAERSYHSGKLELEPINLGIGKFVNDKGQTPQMESVSRAVDRARVRLNVDKNGGYLPITGEPNFCAGVEDLVLGQNTAHSLRQEGRLVTVQSLGGTGALNLAAQLLKQGGVSEIYVSNPTWANHHKLFNTAGLETPAFPYLNWSTNTLDFSEMMESHSELSRGTVIKEDACCHNPTGCDRTKEQWDESAELYKKRGLVALFDSAYAGFGDSVDQDLYGVRKFVEMGVPTLLCFSFSKTAGLYEERLGALLVITPPDTGSSPGQSLRIKENLASIIRTTYSNPPALHARAMAEVLLQTEPRAQWLREQKEIATQIQNGRELMVSALEKRGLSTGEIATQKGMFSFLPISDSIADRLERDAQIYMVGKRINFAAVKAHNIEAIADRIAILS
jgi:aspartate/tyrosine/aromatic aminotransferase